MYRNQNKSTLDGMSNHFVNSAAEAWLVGLRYKITIHYRLEGWRCLLFYRLNAKLQWAKNERSYTHQACHSRRKHKHTSERRLGDNDHVTGNARKFRFCQQHPPPRVRLRSDVGHLFQQTQFCHGADVNASFGLDLRTTNSFVVSTYNAGYSC